jgi:hypothetical protein
MQIEILDVECPYCAQSGILEVDPSAGESQEITSDCEICCRPIRFEINIDLSEADGEDIDAKSAAVSDDDEFEDAAEEDDDFEDLEDTEEDFEDEDALYASGLNDDEEESDDEDLEAEDNYGSNDAFESMTKGKQQSKSKQQSRKKKSDLRIQISAYREEDI